MKLFKKIALLTFLSLIFLSCSKDQKYVKWLGDGSWELTSATTNGVEQNFGGTLTHTTTHEECKVKNGDCTGSSNYTIAFDSGETVTGGTTFTYKVHEDGTKITYTTLTQTYDGTTTDCTNDCESIWDIEEMTKETHVQSLVGDDGNTYKRTFNKK